MDRRFFWSARDLARATPWALLVWAVATPSAHAAETSTTADRVLAEAKAFIASGAADKAKPLLESASTVLDDEQKLLLGRALAALGQDQRAYAVLDQIKAPKSKCTGAPDHPLYVDAMIAKAKLLAESEPVAAAQLLTSLKVRGDLLAEAADLYRRGGDEHEAQKLEATLLVEVPESPEARLLTKSLRQNGVKRRLKTTEMRVQRIKQLLETQQNADAKTEGAYLLGELSKASAERCELAYTVGKAARKLREYQTAEKWLLEARERCAEQKNEELALKSALLEAQVRAIRGEVKETEKIASWIGAKQSSFGDDALILYGNLLEESGRPLEAKKIYQRIVEEMADGDQSPEAAWRLAYMAIGAEDHADAQKHLGWIIAQRDVAPVERARARYWLARTMEKSDASKSRALFEETVMEPSFYAWLALTYLQRAEPEWAEDLKSRLLSAREKEAQLADPRAPAIIDSKEYDRAQRFALIGEKAYAEAELDRLACAATKDDEVLTLASAFDRVGSYPKAQELLRARAAKMLAGPLRPESLPVWRLAYSRPFYDLVEKAAGAEKIEPMFLLALVREESTFDPAIVSWAGAIGLSQLMPGTAMVAHVSLGMGRLDVERLIEPELNLRLGAHVLREGMRSFANQEALALVAYNGGPGVAQRLVDRAKPKPFDRWVEDIRIRETRRYVKRVLETWGIYRLLYDREHPFIALPASIGRS
jgi:soluble lytic murein transglycosylase